jgi:predicted RNA-binding protein with PUA-like domain
MLSETISFWLAKSEPSTYSIDDLATDKVTWWDGVRNYQARNNLREMKKGDFVLIYHSSTNPPGVVGVAKVLCDSQPDATQFQVDSPYYDDKATSLKPRWFCPQLGYVCTFDTPVLLSHLKEDTLFSDLPLVHKGSRLSVMHVSHKHFKAITTRGGSAHLFALTGT